MQTLVSLRLQVLEDYEALSQAAASAVSQCLASSPESTLLLPTSSTPRGMYRHLVNLHERGSLSFSRARCYNLDEYVGLPPEHPHSFRAYMWRNLYSHVDANPNSVQVPNGMARDREAECRRYEDAMRSDGGIDLCVLGVGKNGHIGFNEPGSPVDSRTRVVRLGSSTREANAETFGDDEVPELAITVGIRTILKARRVLLLASGQDKARIVEKALEGPVDEAVPASFLRLHHNVTMFLDLEAASSLRSFPETIHDPV